MKRTHEEVDAGTEKIKVENASNKRKPTPQETQVLEKVFKDLSVEFTKEGVETVLEMCMNELVSRNETQPHVSLPLPKKTQKDNQKEVKMVRDGPSDSKPLPKKDILSMSPPKSVIPTSETSTPTRPRISLSTETGGTPSTSQPVTPSSARSDSMNTSFSKQAKARPFNEAMQLLDKFALPTYMILPFACAYDYTTGSATFSVIAVILCVIIYMLHSLMPILDEKVMRTHFFLENLQLHEWSVTFVLIFSLSYFCIRFGWECMERTITVLKTYYQTFWVDWGFLKFPIVEIIEIIAHWVTLVLTNYIVTFVICVTACWTYWIVDARWKNTREMYIDETTPYSTPVTSRTVSRAGTPVTPMTGESDVSPFDQVE
jgi:hypothetical protein